MAEEAIEVWQAAASEDAAGPLEQCCHGWLPAEEQQRADRFRLPSSRHQFIVGRGMLRRLLSRRLGVDPQDVPLAFAAYGKPYLAGCHQPQFNIAHTAGRVVCALASAAVIGVDIEAASRRVDLDLAARYFSAQESAWLSSLPAALQPEAFLKIWTLKESFIKAIGTGLSMPLDQFAFQQIDSPQPRLWLQASLENQQHGPAAAWQSRLIPTDDYFVAVTIRAPRRPPITLHTFQGD